MNSLTGKDWNRAFSFLEENGVSLPIKSRDSFQKDLSLFLELLLKKNEQLNLTAIRDPMDGLWKHIVDSLLLAKCGELGELLDWGSGGGLPGIPYLLYRRAHKSKDSVYFLDSVGKKLQAINEFCSELNLESSFFHERGEQFILRKDRPAIDTICMRAVAPPSRAIPWIDHSIKSWIFFLGPKQREEWLQEQSRLQRLGFSCIFSQETILPAELGRRSFLQIQSLRST